MGVSGFYRWLVQKYPLVRHRINDLAHPKINHFYIDFNCIVYNSIRLVKPSENGDNTTLFNEVCRYIDLIVQIIKPETTLFIAVDGSAPIAKCSQQRTRRFCASREHVPGTFSTANISVGTEFMEALHQHLYAFIQKRSAEDLTWKRPKIIYSSYRTPGEGEHKFFTYIRKHMEDEIFTKNETHCIYSPDADLIFLSLQTGIRNFYIMREWTSWMGGFEDVGNGELDKMRASRNDFELLHLPILLDYFQKQYGAQEDLKRFVTDFIAVSFLVGNDFIPHFPEIYINHGDLDHLIDNYRATVVERHMHLVNEDNTFNKEALYTFLISLSNHSKRKDSKKAKKEKPKFDFYSVKGAKKYLQNKYKEKYDEKFEEKLCHSIIDSFNWVLKYYLEGVPSWTWSFNYHYAPPLILVAEYVKEHESTFELGRPPFPFEQLLSILPPQMSKLLPEAYSSLMFKPSPIAYMYPEKFKIDLNGRKFEHEGVTLIPFIDVNLVRSEAEKMNELLKDDEKERNTFLDEFIISEGNPIRQEKEHGFIPCLNNIEYEMEYRPINLKVFRHGSTDPSFFISPKLRELPSEKAEDYKDQLGKNVFFDWPFLRRGKICGVFDNIDCFVYDKDKNIIRVPAQKKHDTMCKMLRTVRGINADASKIGVLVTPLIVSSAEEGTTGGNEQLLFPFELLQENTRLLNRYVVPDPEQPKVGDLVVLTGANHQGRKAIIKGFNNGNASVQLINEDLLDISFLKYENYQYTLDQIAEELDYPCDLVRSMLSSIPVGGCKDIRDADIALTVIYGDKFVLDGYATRRGEKILFTKEVLPVIREYLEKFGLDKILRRLKPNKKGKYFVSLKEIGKESTVAEIMNWVKNESRLSGKFLIDSHIKMLTKTATDKLCIRLKSHEYKQSEGEIIEVPTKEIYFRGKVFGNIPARLPGSRITTLAQRGPVPFGTSATIVGYDIRTTEIYAIADQPFELGSNLRIRLDSPRGFVMYSKDAVNIK